MILLRHGQSEFNLHFAATRQDPGIVDPRLTPLGHEQAEAAAETLLATGLAAGGAVRQILASPYTRALQTAAPFARRLGLPVRIHPVVRERCAFACDIGSPVSALVADWPEHDFSHLEEVWWPSLGEPTDSVIARATAFRAEMASLPDWRHTLVVSHWGFILAMTGQSVGNGQWLRCDLDEPPPAAVRWQHH
ncbi:histidine phosphatase family protein [Roseomonas sp. NAR14]|uniref:Histidine phosphatase family protein n=1 Tax=Roseomonas acroporae TaxID=2937791 RepID=A0A9X2BW32_9PROT|nr:histidine phosphatase family protein [Roseomonas acroporae]MCK8787318.1 histidine phosphatase family protein [Roseomonas acroporae]